MLGWLGNRIRREAGVRFEVKWARSLEELRSWSKKASGFRRQRSTLSPKSARAHRPAIVPRRRGEVRRGRADSRRHLREMRPDDAWAQQVAKVTHPASARVLEQLRTRFTFQIPVDVATIAQGVELPARRRRQDHHRRNGDAAAQERRRLSRRRARLPAVGNNFPRRSCSPI